MQEETYAPLQNEQILQQNSQEVTEIENEYGQCFTETMGDMLTNGDLDRDSNGNIESDNARCSPSNLGTYNPQYCEVGSGKPKVCDLVFRWRLEHDYENATNTLTGIQNANTGT